MPDAKCVCVRRGTPVSLIWFGIQNFQIWMKQPKTTTSSFILLQTLPSTLNNSDGNRYTSLRWIMVLGQPLHKRTRSFWLVPEVYHFGSYHQSLCSSKPIHPRCWFRQFRQVNPKTKLFFFISQISFYDIQQHPIFPFLFGFNKNDIFFAFNFMWACQFDGNFLLGCL